MAGPTPAASEPRLTDRSRTASPLLANLAEIERTREGYWRRYPGTSPTRLRWRACAVRHALHPVAGENVLELGAGSGLWTTHLVDALRGECPVTAAVFNRDLAVQAAARSLPATDVVFIRRQQDLPAGHFDNVVGAAILSHDRYEENLDWLYSLLRPGGQLLFFEANFWNPQVFVKAKSRRLSRWSSNAECQIALRNSSVSAAATRSGFTDIQIVQYDILHPRTPHWMIRSVQSLAFVLEQLPGVRQVCGTLFIHARKVGRRHPNRADLADHESLRDAVSVVVPCRNEAQTLPEFVERLTRTYDGYLHEIILVVDPSTDATLRVTQQLVSRNSRVRLIKREPPPGVGLALRDGYAAATRRYILSIDADFTVLIPELRDLFDAIVEGHEGAIGSRFSHDSVLLGYPTAKLLGNRAFHTLVRLLLRLRVRDVTNNLKLYRAELLRNLEISETGFAANAETGLFPLLAGHDIKEVPIAWINRSEDMGASAFRVASAARGYVRVLSRALRTRRETIEREHSRNRR